MLGALRWVAAITSGDFNDYKQTGFWTVQADTANLQNCPITEGGTNVRGLLIVLSYGNIALQITFETRTSGQSPKPVYYRQLFNNAEHGWSKWAYFNSNVVP